ncbi:hypothetical protein HCN58_31165 [Bradyrhizobium sp. WSM 1791]|uniref:Uncharacterized protein n=1 Tax=Bradyrhizobium australiense TaxID=2721161 RepID=A0A7Y4GYF6_9BRAD|nr:hypothetical protein [Bradyrhizobium australiense]
MERTFSTLSNRRLYGSGDIVQRVRLRRETLLQFFEKKRPEQWWDGSLTARTIHSADHVLRRPLSSDSPSTSFFRLLFSSSSYFNRSISVGSNPSYFFFQLIRSPD